ncbi:MAG TPA: DoxX family protein [Candidatus Limnocylindria bacterium]
MEDLGIAIIRIVVGLTFAAHGAQKAFGWWDGPGYEGWSGAIHKMGWRPVAFWAPISIAAELLGGLSLALGLLMPLAIAALVAQSITIIRRAHWASGFWNKNNGYEYPLVLLAAVLGLYFTGPGVLSFDAFLPVGLLYSSQVSAALLGAGIVGGVGAAFWPSPATAQQHG